MKRSLISLFAAIIVLLIGLNGEVKAGTYASNLRATNPDTVKPFDGVLTDGSGARLWFTLNGRADTAKVWVRQGGSRIRSFAPLLNLAPGSANVLWDGKDDSGRVVLTGRYTFEVFTSDTGNSTSNWALAWQNSVYLLSGGGLSCRDIDVVTDPNSPAFGNLIITEATTTYLYARMLVASSDGTLKGEYSRSLFPQGTSDFDPWFVNLGRNGFQYVTSSTKQSIFVFRDSILVQTINDTAKFKDPKGIAAFGTDPTLFFANNRSVLRRIPSGKIDTVFTIDTTGGVVGYTRDVALDDSGYVFVAYGPTSAAYTKVIRLSKTFVPLDTLTLPDNVTHLNLFHGANPNSNTDDILYCRVRGANGGAFKLDFVGKTFTKLFTPATSTSGSHSIGIDILGNIYYANPSGEWVQMYIPPTTAPTKWTTVGGDLNVMAAPGTKVIDNFNATVGHFNQVPTFSGSTVGVSASSSALWSQAASVGPQSGSVQVTFLNDFNSSSAWEVRLLSGTGTTTNNDSLGAVGWVGYWLKTATAPAGAFTAIGLDDPSDPTTKRSVKLPVNNDGEWHLYQWNIADSLQWTPWVVTSGSAKIKGPRVSIDAVWFFAPDSSNPWMSFLDDVSYNPNGQLGNEAGRGDVTEDGTISALDASWILQFVVKQRILSLRQIASGDVNLSHNGTADNAFDAATILAFVVGKIPALPFTQPLPTVLENINHKDPAPLSIIVASAKGSSGQIVTIPISVPLDLAGVRSAEMKLNYNSSAMKVLSVNTTNLTKDFMVASNIGDGSVAIAMACGDGLEKGGQILSVEVEILQSSADLSVRLENVSFNDQKINSVTSVGGNSTELPTSYNLLQNYPNPFNPTTTIEYQLPQTGFVELTVYDITGREVSTLVSTIQNAGYYRVNWNAADNRGNKVASGVYMYRMTAGSFTQIKKMMLLK